MAVPGKIVDLSVVREDDDFLVRMTLDSGEIIETRGLALYDPPVPFGSAVDVFGFLIMQDTPAELIYRELNAVDPDWEQALQQRRDAQPWSLARREEEHARRAALRETFLGQNRPAAAAGRYRWRTRLRSTLPGALSHLIPKGRADCGNHEWYSADDIEEHCYHCAVGIRRRSA